MVGMVFTDWIFHVGIYEVENDRTKRGSYILSKLLIVYLRKLLLCEKRKLQAETRNAVISKKILKSLLFVRAARTSRIDWMTS